MKILFLSAFAVSALALPSSNTEREIARAAEPGTSSLSYKAATRNIC